MKRARGFDGTIVRAAGRLPLAARRAGQRGAVLVFAVVMILVLATLALAMAMFSFSDERTGLGRRDTAQVAATAESGARIVLQMFRDAADRRLVPVFHAGPAAGPDWDYYGTDEESIETSLNAIGIFRSPRPAVFPERYAGLGSAAQPLEPAAFFRGPFDRWQTFFGGVYHPDESRNIADLRMRCTPPPGNRARVRDCWLDRRVNRLLDVRLGRITEIAFYAPPIANGTAYGIATVRVTAQTMDGHGRVLAHATAEAVIGRSGGAGEGGSSQTESQGTPVIVSLNIVQE